MPNENLISPEWSHKRCRGEKEFGQKQESFPESLMILYNYKLSVLLVLSSITFFHVLNVEIFLEKSINHIHVLMMLSNTVQEEHSDTGIVL